MCCVIKDFSHLGQIDEAYEKPDKIIIKKKSKTK